MIEVSTDHGRTFGRLADTDAASENLFAFLVCREWTRQGIRPALVFDDLDRGEFRSPAGFHYRRAPA